MAEPDSFQNWLTLNGVRRHGIEVGTFEGGVRGVVASEHLEAGENTKCMHAHNPTQ